MRFEFQNGDHSGSAEWQGPGQVMVTTTDPDRQAWFERYFEGETSFMNGPVECGEMSFERRDESEAAFTRAAYELAAYSYKVRQRDNERRGAYAQRARAN